MTFTQASENVAIFCLAKNDWKLEQASDNFFQNPLEYDTVKINTQLGYSVDKRKLETMYTRYRGKTSYFLIIKSIYIIY
jgi:DCN1-like protein 1/2